MKAKKFLSMILALTMIMSLMTTLNVSAARNSIGINDTVNGDFYCDEEDDSWYYTWRSIEIPKDGKLSVSLLGDSEMYFTIKIFDEDKDKQYTYDSGRDKTLKMSEYLSAGSYYIYVETSRYDDLSGDYTLKTSFEAQELANDKENNDSFQKANVYNIDTSVTGHIGYMVGRECDEIDWYRINIPVEGYISLSLLADPEVDATLSLYRNDGDSRITYQYGMDKVLTIDSPLLPGEYYVRVSCDDYDGAGGYTLSNKFKIFGKTNESEPNDSFQKSKEMSNGGVFVGTIGSYSNDDRDKKDWYKIYVPAGVYLRADLATEETLGADVRIYNVDGGSQMTYAYTYDGGNAKCYKKIETAGTYYICVDDPNGYGRYAVMATTSVNEPKHASSLTVPADPTAYQEVTIPTPSGSIPKKK